MKDPIELTASAYDAVAKLALFTQIHQPSKKAYLASLLPKPTKNDMDRLTKELEMLRQWGEEMKKEVMLMVAQPIPEDSDVESTGEEKR